MATVNKWIAAIGGHYIDPKSGGNVRFEAGEPYFGPNPEKLAAQGIVVPAPAGSSQPGKESERDEA